MLNYKYKLPGILLVLLGILLTGFYVGMNLRFEIPVLAVFSSYLESRFFTVFKTNFADETILLLMLCGFSLWVFSQEKNEHEGLKVLRAKALQKAIITDVFIMAFSILFVYGSIFMAIIVVNLFLPFILYLSYFYFLRYKSLSKK